MLEPPDSLLERGRFLDLAIARELAQRLQGLAEQAFARIEQRALEPLGRVPGVDLERSIERRARLRAALEPEQNAGAVEVEVRVATSRPERAVEPPLGGAQVTSRLGHAGDLRQSVRRRVRVPAVLRERGPDPLERLREAPLQREAERLVERRVRRLRQQRRHAGVPRSFMA